MIRLLEECTIIFLVLFFIHQIGWPMAMGRKVFPLFRREHKLQAELSEVQQSLHEQELAEELAKERSKLSTNQEDK